MPKLFFTRHYPIIIVTALVLLTAAAGDNVTEALRFERQAILNGELYRLLSAHIVHLSWPHTLMNLTAAVIGWYLFHDAMNNKHWLLSLAGCGLVISLLLLGIDTLQWYVGFSGIIHGVMLQGLVLDRQLGRGSKSIMLSGLILKVAYEQWQGRSISSFEAIGGDVVLEAHLFGLAGGLLMLALPRLAKRVPFNQQGDN